MLLLLIYICAICKLFANDLNIAPTSTSIILGAHGQGRMVLNEKYPGISAMQLAKELKQNVGAELYAHVLNACHNLRGQILVIESLGDLSEKKKASSPISFADCKPNISTQQQKEFKDAMSNILSTLPKDTPLTGTLDVASAMKPLQATLFIISRTILVDGKSYKLVKPQFRYSRERTDFEKQYILRHSKFNVTENIAMDSAASQNETQVDDMNMTTSFIADIPYSGNATLDPIDTRKAINVNETEYDQPWNTSAHHEGHNYSMASSSEFTNPDMKESNESDDTDLWPIDDESEIEKDDLNMTDSEDRSDIASSSTVQYMTLGSLLILAIIQYLN